MRDNVLTAIARRKDSPPTVASLAMARVLYGDKHPYGWPMTGVEASLKKLTVADLRKFYEANYRPNNAVLIVAGDVTEAELRAKLEPPSRAGSRSQVAAAQAAGARPRLRQDQDLSHRQGRRAAVVDPRRPGRHRADQPRLLPRSRS